MQTELLRNDLIEMIAEQQIKLGYRSEAIRFYYPLRSLCRLLGTDCTAAEMEALLPKVLPALSDPLGPIEATRIGDMFCLALTSAAQDWVQQNGGDRPFLKELIALLSQHGATMDDALAVFFRYSDHVVVEPKTDRDFDVLVYFADGVPDAYRYCLTDEGCHVIYHRFHAADYLDFYPEG